MYSELTLYKTLCGLAIAASALPLIWHAKTGNIPAICLIVWIALFNIISFINAFVWGENIFTAWEGRVFCDIEIKFIIAASAGKMGAIAAAARNLANIMRDDLPVVKTRAAKRRQTIEDLLLCFGVPVWMMGIHYVVQPSRYWLVEIMGCTPVVDNSWPSIVLVFIWPPIIALVATYFCILVFVRLRRYRHEFEQILSNTSGTTTRSRFLRLYIYCSGLILFLLPTSYYTFYRHIHVERLPYSWKLIHDPEEWKIIYRIPTNGHVAFDKWIIIGAGLILFIFFGLGHDAAIMYRGWMKTVGLDKHWDRMKKRQQKHGMQQSMSSGWSGSTGMGKATNTGIMNSIASVTDRDDFSEITALHMDDTTKTWTQTTQKSLLSKTNISSLDSKGPSNSAAASRQLTSSPSAYSLPDLNITSSPFIKQDAANMTDTVVCDFAFQDSSVNNSGSGSGSSQHDIIPRLCTVPTDGKDCHMSEQPDAACCKSQDQDFRKGKGKAEGVADGAEGSSIMVETEIRVE